MIKSFASKETELIWSGEFSRKLPQNIQQTARNKLRMINNSTSVMDLRLPPSNRLEALKGKRKDQFSIRINDQWRICFSFRDGNAFNVEILDYH